MNESLDRQVQESANKYRPDPQLKWEEVEKRMKSQSKSKNRRLYSIVAIAATIVLLLGVFLFNQWNIKQEKNNLFASADSISELQSQDKEETMPGRYSLSEIYQAYARAGLLQEGGDDLNGWR
jgi:hypothetical protein